MKSSMATKKRNTLKIHTLVDENVYQTGLRSGSRTVSNRKDQIENKDLEQIAEYKVQIAAITN